MPKFEKGHKGPGRPKGSKDKAYLTIQYWYNELMKDWDKIRPAQRAKLAMQLMQMLTNKMKQLPGSPEESLANATEAQATLNILEGIKNNDLNEVMPHQTPLPPVINVNSNDNVNEGKGSEGSQPG